MGLEEVKKKKNRPKGLKYNIKKENKSWFKIGQISWSKRNKGTGVMKVNSGSFKKGEHPSPKTEFKDGDTLGEKNYKWKGDKVGYFGLHSWIRRALGKAKVCEQCGSDKKVQWANKSGEYKREETDWLTLCCWCHRKYDGKNWGNIRRRYGVLAG